MEAMSDEIHFFLLVACIFILGALSVFYQHSPDYASRQGLCCQCCHVGVRPHELIKHLQI